MVESAAYPEVFIVSTGRCGSTLMSNLIRLHPEILSLSEFFMGFASRAFVYEAPTGAQFWDMLSKPSAALKKVWDPGQNPTEFLYEFGPGARFDRETLPPISFVTLPHVTDDPDGLIAELEEVIPRRPRAPLAEHYRFFFHWLQERLEKTLWIERSGGSLAMVAPLAKLFPDAKFVHVYRDGRDVAMSFAGHPPMKLFAQNWHMAKRFGVDLLRPPFRLGTNRFIAWAEPLVEPFSPIEKQLASPCPIPKIGTFWSEMIKVGLEDLNAIPAAQRLDISYEDLMADPAGALTRFIRFVDPRLEHSTWIAEAAAIPSPGRNKWKELPEAERAALEEACAPGLALLGYAD